MNGNTLLQHIQINRNRHNIIWGIDGKSHSQVACDFLTTYWKQPRFNTMTIHQKMLVDKNYSVIDPKDVDKELPKIETLKGMSDYYCFVFKEKGKVMYRKFGCYCKQCLLLNYEQCTRKYICGEWKHHTFKLKSTDIDSDHRRVTQMKALKEFVMDFYELQHSNVNCIDSKTSYIKMQLKTESALVKHLQFVYCMQTRNECIFDAERCKLSMRKYMKDSLKYEKVDDLYRNNKLPQNSIPNLRRLGIRVIVVQQNIDNDNDQLMEENENVVPFLEEHINVQYGPIRGTDYEHQPSNPY